MFRAADRACSADQSSTRRLPTLAGSLAILAALGLGSCDRADRVTAPQAVAPVVDSPVAAVRALEWAFAHRDAIVIEGLLSADFGFHTAVLDSAGHPGGGMEAWDRERVLRTIRALFAGEPTGSPAARRVSLVLDRDLVSVPDTRPGMDPLAHRILRTSVDFRVEHATGDFSETSGFLLFFLSRGDSCAVPDGAGGDPPPSSSGRWWITRMEDESSPVPIGSPARASALP